MLSLALQMLANGIEMTHDQITTLNYLVVSNLGFKHCRLDKVDGVLSVDFGEFEYMPDDFSQNMKMHKIVQDKLDKEQLKEREDNVINAIRKTFELIPKNITEENKQLIIELSTSLLKRAHMLTVTILGTQIITTGKLLTKHKNDTNTVANDDTEELDMFKVLQDVIQDEQITYEEASGTIYLRDEPVRD
ncbi:5278_t:CDS:2, partial [Racocetra fulgida]